MEFSILKKCSILPGKYSLFRDSQHLTHHPKHPRFTRPELQAPHQPKIWKVKHRNPRTRPQLQLMFFLTSRCHAKLVAKYFKINPLTAFICLRLLHVSIHGSAISPFTLTETPAPPGQSSACSPCSSPSPDSWGSYKCSLSDGVWNLVQHWTTRRTRWMKRNHLIWDSLRGQGCIWDTLTSKCLIGLGVGWGACFSVLTQELLSMGFLPSLQKISLQESLQNVFHLPADVLGINSDIYVVWVCSSYRPQAQALPVCQFVRAHPTFPDFTEAFPSVSSPSSTYGLRSTTVSPLDKRSSIQRACL